MRYFATFMMGGTLAVALSHLTMTKDTVWQKEAIAHGAAEWVVDQKTGNTTFKWKQK